MRSKRDAAGGAAWQALYVIRARVTTSAAFRANSWFGLGFDLQQGLESFSASKVSREDLQREHLHTKAKKFAC